LLIASLARDVGVDVALIEQPGSPVSIDFTGIFRVIGNMGILFAANLDLI
jgi:hypothetical protein